MKVEPVDGLVKGEWIFPREFLSSEPVVYYLHGGGYISGSAKSCRPITATLARLLQARVFGLDYRLPPGNRFPAGLGGAVGGVSLVLPDGNGSKTSAGGGGVARGGM